MNWAGFGAGFSNGLDTGDKMVSSIHDMQIRHVREAGMAEAKALQQQAAPKVTDNGDAENLTARPQASSDPGAAPVETRLPENRPDPAAPDAIVTAPVSASDVQDSTQLSNRPLSSAPMAGAMVPAAEAQPAATASADPAAAKGFSLAQPKRFNVDGKEFDTAEQAAAHVKKSTPPLADFYKTTLIPKMAEAYIAQGKPEMAAAWQKYADDSDTQQHMKTYSKAVKLAQFGDYSGSAQELMKLHPHYQDGYDLVGAEATKGPDGSDGFTMTIKGPDGKEQQMFQNARTLTQLGLSQMSPDKMFEKQYDSQQKADIAKIGANIQTKKITALTERETLRQDGANTRSDARIESADSRAEEARTARAAADDKKIAAKKDQIDQTFQLRAKEIANGTAYRKAVSPEERQAIVVAGMAKDPLFQMKTPAEQKAAVEQVMSLIPQAKAKPAAPVAPAGPTGAVPNPFAPAAPAAPQQAGVPVFDPATGAIKFVSR